MSLSKASILSRIEDTLIKYTNKLSPILRKIVLTYTYGQNFDRAKVKATDRYKEIVIGIIAAVAKEGEVKITDKILGLASKLYTFSHNVEVRILATYRAFAKKAMSIQASLEDAVSLSSLYMNFLFVVSVLLMVVIAWGLM